MTLETMTEVGAMIQDIHYIEETTGRSLRIDWNNYGLRSRPG